MIKDEFQREEAEQDRIQQLESETARLREYVSERNIEIRNLTAAVTARDSAAISHSRKAALSNAVCDCGICRHMPDIHIALAAARSLEAETTKEPND